ncbi:MAG: porin family protein [Gemmatimonadota bacterium]|nr:porin family protein [Gemmatimonadota bacterium]
MNRIILSTLAGVVATAAATSNAGAQFSSNPFQIGAAAGIAFPSGDLGNAVNTGYNVTLAVGYKPMLTPIGVRVEAAYNEFGGQAGGGNINIPAFTGNLVYALPGVSFSPYVIGGAGLYTPNIDVNGGRENRFGFNIGGGIKIPLSSSFETFVEARYNRVTVDNGNLSFIPITVGIMW